MTQDQTPTPSKYKAVQSILAGSQSVMNVAKSFGVSRSSVYRWLERYEDEGSLARKPVSGRPPKIDQTSGKKIIKIISQPASKYGYDSDFWTTRRIVQVTRKELKLKISRMAVLRVLRKFEQSYRRPEVRYYEADTKAQQEWRKKTVPIIKRTVTRHNAILYFEDESSIQLAPVVAKTWGPIGQKLVQKQTGNRGSVSAISAISNSGRLIFNVFQGGKRFNSNDIINFLKEMLKHHARRHLVVVMDQAPCHTSKKVKTFVASQKRLHVFYLPPRSPEYNPDEKVWNHLKHQELKSHSAKNLKELRKLAKSKLRSMAKDPKKLLGIYRMSEAAVFFG